MSEQVKVAVVYYSSTGTVYELAKSIVEGAEKAGAEVRLRKVHELAPDEAIAANAGWASHAAEAQHVAEATAGDILWADAVIFGSPTRFGNIASQLKQFIDTLGGPWMQGQLAEGNPYGTSHIADHGDLPITGTTRHAAAYQGARVVNIAAALKTGLHAS